MPASAHQVQNVCRNRYALHLMPLADSLHPTFGALNAMQSKAAGVRGSYVFDPVL